MPAFRIRTNELARWIDDQGPHAWWSVDGDPVLSGRLSFPCPGDELANELRKLDGNRELIVGDGNGGDCPAEYVDAERLGELVETDDDDFRVLQLRWSDDEFDWILVEDEETSESSGW